MCTALSVDCPWPAGTLDGNGTSAWSSKCEECTASIFFTSPNYIPTRANSRAAPEQSQASFPRSRLGKFYMHGPECRVYHHLPPRRRSPLSVGRRASPSNETLRGYRRIAHLVRRLSPRHRRFAERCCRTRGDGFSTYWDSIVRERCSA